MNEWRQLPQLPPHEALGRIVKTANEMGYNIRDISLVYYVLPDEYLISVTNIEHKTESVNKVGK